MGMKNNEWRMKKKIMNLEFKRLNQLRSKKADWKGRMKWILFGSILFGLSTGPHLDYRLAKDGKYRDPLKETFRAGVPLRKEEREKFEKRKNEILVWLKGDTSLDRPLSTLPKRRRRGKD